MSTEIIAGVHATRAEMLRLRRRVQFARRGHDLLVEKRDALLLHFFEAIRNITAIREKLVKSLDEAYKEFMRAQLILGSDKLLEVSYSVPERFDITERTRNVIGVLLPFFELNIKEKPEKGWWYGLSDTSASLDNAIKTMENTLKLMVELAEVETAVKRLAEVITMTKRRVNALEKVIIPRLENTIRFIQMHLEERAREDFFRLKRIKAIHEARRVEIPAT
ncbi:MAG: V-type ATP synthase subunit D [Candidatus Hecatellales archaeon]|nr:MAG: V-type ATP synthase subunit D [Candidatus Hecatellales archaeon]